MNVLNNNLWSQILIYGCWEMGWCNVVALTRHSTQCGTVLLSIFASLLRLHSFISYILLLHCSMCVPHADCRRSDRHQKNVQQMHTMPNSGSSGAGAWPCCVWSRQRITVALSIGITKKKYSKRICRCRTFVQLRPPWSVQVLGALHPTPSSPSAAPSAAPSAIEKRRWRAHQLTSAHANVCNYFIIYVKNMQIAFYVDYVVNTSARIVLFAHIHTYIYILNWDYVSV